MKRDRYAGDYDEVARQARMRNAMRQTEFFDPDEPAEAQTAAYVRKVADEAMQRLDNGAQEAERERRAALSAEADVKREAFNKQMIRSEYLALGLTPPTPLISLSLLKLLGWTLAKYTVAGEDRWELLRPVGKKQKPRNHEPDLDDDIGF